MSLCIKGCSVPSRRQYIFVYIVYSIYSLFWRHSRRSLNPLKIPLPSPLLKCSFFPFWTAPFFLQFVLHDWASLKYSFSQSLLINMWFKAERRKGIIILKKCCFFYVNRFIYKFSLARKTVPCIFVMHNAIQSLSAQQLSTLYILSVKVQFIRTKCYLCWGNTYTLVSPSVLSSWLTRTAFTTGVRASQNIVWRLV